VYNYNTDSYSIESGGNFGSAYYAGPGYLYDAASGSYVACSGISTCTGNAGTDPVIFNLAGSADGSAISTGGITINSNDPTSGTGTGFFSWLFGGSWNLPQFSGGANEVPEPGSLLLFGGATAFIARRRRKRAAG
jgi:hypothetical protein